MWSPVSRPSPGPSHLSPPRLRRLWFKFSQKLRMCPCFPRQRRISYACPAGTKSDPWVWLLPMTRYKSHLRCSPEVLAIKIQCRSTWNTYEMTGSQRCRGDTTGLLIAKRRWSEFVMRGPVWIAVRMSRRPSGSESIGSGNSKKLGTLCFVNHIAVIYSSLALNLVSLGGWFISSNVPFVRFLHPSGSWTQRSGFGPE